MKKHTRNPIFLIVLIFLITATVIYTNAQSDNLSYEELHLNFASPDYSYWGGKSLCGGGKQIPWIRKE